MQVPLPTPTERGVADPKRAVVYARVSTIKQVNKDAVDPDGYSLPAQRDACIAKAEALGAEVVDVYVDRGESAKTADRPQFQAMLARIRQSGDVDYVVIDKIDRLARNRRDDANILYELRTAGVELVSVKENIDATPAGMLTHGILATLAEWESRNNAVRTISGMTQKAKVGGTPGRAPVGYLNVPDRIDGRETRTVVVDPERAALVQWAFTAYATGEWTITTLTEALQAKGLEAQPQGNRRAVPIHRSNVAKLLSNRYYLGYVSFKGVEYDGRHQPLVTRQTFDIVGELLASRNRAGEKQRDHHHYLKGSVFCARCGFRLCIDVAKGHYYFFCLGRKTHRTDCQMRYLRIESVEEAVERYYAAAVRMPEVVQQEVREGLASELDYQRRHAEPQIARAQRRVKELSIERRRLARGVVDGSIPGDLARDEHIRIDAELESAEKILATSMVVWEQLESTLNKALELVGRCDEVYRRGSGRVRRLCNQFFFDKLLVDEGEIAGAIYAEPWATIKSDELRVRLRRRTRQPEPLSTGPRWKNDCLVPPAGFEPATR